MRVDINDVKQRLIESFKANPIFNENNIGVDNTPEDKVFGFVLKFQEIFNFNLDNLYEKLKTLKLEPLSVYSNNGVVSYDATENVGKISLTALKSDEENKYNVDNIFSFNFLCLLIPSYLIYLFQNCGVKIMSTENISKRPTSMKNEHIHFTCIGSSDQLIVGPISIPSVGPTFPTQLRIIVIELVLSMPDAMSTNDITRQMSRYTVRKARRVTLFCCGTFCPSTLSGSTAFGCRSCLN